MSTDSNDQERQVSLAGQELLESLSVPERPLLTRLALAEVPAIRVEYGLAVTPFGECLIATRENRVCHLSLHDPDERTTGLELFRQYWPNHRSEPDHSFAQSLVSNLFAPEIEIPELILPGTQFQHQVWERLLAIPFGGLTTYGAIARAIGAPGSSRAVGTAVGANRIAWLIPCHRVIPQNRSLGGFRWGLPRKRSMISFEQDQMSKVEVLRTLREEAD